MEFKGRSLLQTLFMVPSELALHGNSYKGSDDIPALLKCQKRNCKYNSPNRKQISADFVLISVKTAFQA